MASLGLSGLLGLVEVNFCHAHRCPQTVPPAVMLSLGDGAGHWGGRIGRHCLFPYQLTITTGDMTMWDVFMGEEFLRLPVVPA